MTISNTLNNLNLISDIHLEFRRGLESFKDIVPEKYADAIILAGDIHGAFHAIDFIKYLIDLGYEVFYVHGNHEYYGHSINEVVEFWENIDIEGFHFLNNTTVYKDNVRIIGSTLWASLDTLYVNYDGDVTQQMEVDYFVRQAVSGSSDFTLIEDFDKSLLNFVQEFRKSFSYIFNELSKPFDGKTIVVTHHAPSMQSSLPQYSGNKSNHMFATELGELIMRNDIDYWFHGHMHNSSDYYIGDTRIVCNPYGYHDTGSTNWNYDVTKTIYLEDDK